MLMFCNDFEEFNLKYLI